MCIACYVVGEFETPHLIYCGKCKSYIEQNSFIVPASFKCACGNESRLQKVKNRVDLGHVKSVVYCSCKSLMAVQIKAFSISERKI